MKKENFYLLIYCIFGAASILITCIINNRFNDFIDVTNSRIENYESNFYSKQKYILSNIEEINNRLLALESYNYKDTVYIKEPVKISVTKQDTIIIRYIDETKKPEYIERNGKRIKIFDPPKRILE
jgi:hypothetical protein